MLSNFSACLCVKSRDPSQSTRSTTKPRVNDGLKMRASVRMTRYLETWGAVKPFAHLQSREGFTSENIVAAKGRFKVSTPDSLVYFEYCLHYLEKHKVKRKYIFLILNIQNKCNHKVIYLKQIFSYLFLFIY